MDLIKRSSPYFSRVFCPGDGFSKSLLGFYGNDRSFTKVLGFEGKGSWMTSDHPTLGWLVAVPATLRINIYAEGKGKTGEIICAACLAACRKVLNHLADGIVCLLSRRALSSANHPTLWAHNQAQTIVEEGAIIQNSPDRGQSRKIRFSKFPGSGLKKI